MTWHTVFILGCTVISGMCAFGVWWYIIRDVREQRHKQAQKHQQEAVRDYRGSVSTRLHTYKNQETSQEQE